MASHPTGFKKKMEPTEDPWIGGSGSQDSWNHFWSVRVLFCSCSKATSYLLAYAYFCICLVIFWIWWIIIDLQVNITKFYQISAGNHTISREIDWRFTITAAEFQSHSRTSLPKSSPCCFVNHVSSSCGDCMTLRYWRLGSKACTARRFIDLELPSLKLT